MTRLLRTPVFYRLQAAGSAILPGRQPFPRLLGAAGGLMALLLLSGCGPAKSKTDDAKKSDKQKAKSELTGPLSGEVHGTGWHIPWYARNPKNPHGPPIPVLIADAQTGAMDNHDRNPAIRLRDVRAHLFREGVHAADVQAGQIRADQRTRIVVGTEGVTVKSLTNPPDTVVFADKITWNPHTNLIVAVGHARVVQRPHNGSLPITHTGGRITFDTTFKKVDVEAY